MASVEHDGDQDIYGGVMGVRKIKSSCHHVTEVLPILTYITTRIKVWLCPDHHTDFLTNTHTHTHNINAPANMLLLGVDCTVRSEYLFFLKDRAIVLPKLVHL